MGFFSKAFKSKDRDGAGADLKPKSKKKNVHTNGAVPAPPPKPHWDDAWTRKEVEPEEIQELLRCCTHEMKSRALDMPFLLLPFRPASDPSAARTFIRNFFSMEKGADLKGARLEQELILTEPMVLSSIMKWCWSRLAGGVVTWEAYELFKVGEQDSDMARDAFATFIPLSVESKAKEMIIFDFFDLMAAIAAHGKTNGMGGRKLSRLAGWWAFEQVDMGNGFDGGYKSWSSAADATSHLFFAYLRSLSPDSIRGLNGISALPISLQNLVQETQYPPMYPSYESISKVVMVVNSVSPTPFSLLRRAKNFEYRDDDQVLQQFSNYEDPVLALTDECRRVLKSIASANQSAASTTKASTSLGDSSWSRFEDLGFGSLGDLDEEVDSALGKKRNAPQGLRSAPHTKTNDLGRPTTPSWADFLSSGFVEEGNSPAPTPLFLPPDKILPPIDVDRRGQSSQSHKRTNDDSNLEPGELASINAIELDDAFWWVWITSLAGEETPARKAVFGRCALIETTIRGGSWLLIEEMVKGAAPEPEAGAYIAEKKSRFTFGKKSKMSRTRSTGRNTPPPSIQPYGRENAKMQQSRTNIGPDQHAKIQAAAAALQQRQRHQENGHDPNKASPRRGRQGDAVSTKTNSVFTLQPVIMSEASPAMKWANDYDKKVIRAKYLGDNFAGKGSTTDLATPKANDADKEGSVTPQARKVETQNNDYGFPKQPIAREDSGVDTNRTLPALPAETPGEATLKAPSVPTPSVPAPPAPLPVAPQRRMGRPPPAPLPVDPTTRPANGVAANAAAVPLPATTPMETPEKPLPEAEGEDLELTRTITESQPNGVESPESKKGGKKLKKQQGQGGLKGFFGKKKAPAPYTTSSPPDSAAVAAARAAYTGPDMKPNYTSYNASPSLTRRLSAIGKKKTPPASTPTSAPIPDADETLPSPHAPFQDQYASQASLSHVDSSEQRRATNEFKQFDQGPVDQPAFVPEDSPRRPSFVAEHSTDVPSRLTTPERGPQYERPIGHGEYEPSVSSEERPRTPSPPADRWAQIRKNAAERAGRMSDDPKARDSQDKTEDGEESGEETIESRVARIKARVAELTGNMQSEPNHRP